MISCLYTLLEQNTVGVTEKNLFKTYLPLFMPVIGNMHL